MSLPSTLSRLDNTALRDAFSFLCNEANEITRIVHSADCVPGPPGPQPGSAAANLDGDPVEWAVLPDSLSRDDVESIEHLALVAFYALRDLPPPAISDNYLIQQMEALRGLLEIAYGHRITFRGEDRPRTGTAINKSDAESARDRAQSIRPPVTPKIVGHPHVPDLLILPPDPAPDSTGQGASDATAGKEASGTHDG